MTGQIQWMFFWLAVAGSEKMPQLWIVWILSLFLSRNPLTKN